MKPTKLPPKKVLFSTQKTWNVAGFTILGSLILSIFSFIQKTMLGANAIALRGYIIPSLYGGLTGMLLSQWYVKLQSNALQIEKDEKQLRSLINNLPDFVILKNGDGRWQDVNLAGQKLFQLTQEQCKDRTDLQLAEQNESLYDLFTWCHVTDIETWEHRSISHCEVNSLIVEGSAKIYDVLKIPLYWADGNRQGMVIVGRDITEIRDHERKLVTAYDSTLEGWAKAVEMRDKITEDHTRRVVTLTEKLARILGISENEITHIRRGAMLHDIGKIGIPDSILNKPSALTEEEIQIMHQHPERAREMLSQIEFLAPALDIPYCHHERWDGTGYPRKLKGEEIPLSARIFSVVDVWDALTSDRPYRKAWSHTEALDYINAQSGKFFDMKIANIFSMNIDEMQRLNTDS